MSTPAPSTLTSPEQVAHLLAGYDRDEFAAFMTVFLPNADTSRKHDIASALSQDMLVALNGDLLAVCTDALAAATPDLSGIATLTFGTSEWDNGYFFDAEPVSAVLQATGSPVSDQVLQQVRDALGQDRASLDEILTDMSEEMSLTASDTVVVDLAGRTVTL